MPDVIPAEVKRGLEKQCKKAAKKLSKVAPGEKNEKKLQKLIKDEVCKEVQNLDKKVLKIAAEQLKKLGEKHSAKEPAGTIPKVTAKPAVKAPGSGVPSLELPIHTFLLDEKLDTKGKLSVKIWADPKDLKNSEKGVVLNFTVVNW